MKLYCSFPFFTIISKVYFLSKFPVCGVCMAVCGCLNGFLASHMNYHISQVIWYSRGMSKHKWQRWPSVMSPLNPQHQICCRFALSIFMRRPHSFLHSFTIKLLWTFLVYVMLIYSRCLLLFFHHCELRYPQEKDELMSVTWLQRWNENHLPSTWSGLNSIYKPTQSSHV